MTARLIGLSGYGGVGKDEVGRILIEEWGYTRFAKGDLIKDAAYAINPFIAHDDEFGWAERVWSPLQQIVDHLGWEDAKRIDGVRRFLQDLPDETVRVFGRDAWNDAIFEKINDHFWQPDASPVVLTRVSLPEEAERIVEARGQVWRVHRKGYGPANDHPNERALDSWDFDAVIRNNGTLVGLSATVAATLQRACTRIDAEVPVG